MSEMDRQWLEDVGFEGFASIAELRRTQLAAIPWYPGVYVVLRDGLGPPEFVSLSSGGWFKGRDPSVARELLDAKWIDDAYILYVGKADAGTSGRGLRTRVDEYLRFGSGAAIGHWGGRYLWHVADTLKLRMAWKAADPAAPFEADMLSAFVNTYGQLPFANLRN